MLTLKLTHVDGTTSWASSESVGRIDEWLESLAESGKADTIVGWEFI